MPALIMTILAAIGAAIIWTNRVRGATRAAADIVDLTKDAHSAVKKFGFKREHDKHVVDSIDEPDLAIGGLSVAFLQLANIPTAEQRQGLLRGLQAELAIGMKEAEELTVLGQWFVTECKTPNAAITRLAKRLKKLAGIEGLEDVVAIAKHITSAGDGKLSNPQHEALHEMKNIFRT